MTPSDSQVLLSGECHIVGIGAVGIVMGRQELIPQKKGAAEEGKEWSSTLDCQDMVVAEAGIMAGRDSVQEGGKVK